jgi:hypothetical protein
MSKYDIVVTLFTIVYGLAITDLFLSFHKLIRSGKQVKWHWLPVLAAWYLFLVILKNWWDLVSFQGSTDWMNIYFFLAYGHLLLLIFLLVSVALPDEVQKKHLDLKEYYFRVSRYFWGLMGGVIVLSVAIALIKKLQVGGPIHWTNAIGNGIFLILTMILAVSKRYWLHASLLIFLVLEVFLEIAGR